MGFDYEHFYDGVEDLSNFSSNLEIKKYREEKLSLNKKQANMISQYLLKYNAPRVFEIGTGNGRLIIELKNRGVIDSALGVDISKSRIDFAKKWIAEEGLNDSIKVIKADILDFKHFGFFDVCIIVTDTFGYFDAIKEGVSSQVLDYFRKSLKPGGLLIMELYNHVENIKQCNARNDRTIRFWNYGHRSDPWIYHLHQIKYDEKRKVRKHLKIFVHKNGRIDDSKYEELRLYSIDELRRLLKLSGFKAIDFFADWNGRLYIRGSEFTIVFAK